MRQLQNKFAQCTNTVGALEYFAFILWSLFYEYGYTCKNDISKDTVSGKNVRQTLTATLNTLKNPSPQRVIEHTLFNVVIRNHGKLKSIIMLLISSIVIAEYAMQTFCIPVFLRYQTTV